MQNRFYAAERKRKIVLACAFCVGVACCLAAGAQAASFTSQSYGMSDGAMVVGNDINWALSNGDLQSAPPLATDQEIAMGGFSDHLVSTGNTEYSAASSLDNSDIIHQAHERQVAFTGNGLYDESVFYADFVQSAQGNLCSQAATQVTNGTPDNTTANNEMALWHSQLGGLSLTYHSMGTLDVGAVEMPDTLNMQAEALGNGFGTLGFASSSQSGLANTTMMGYQNGIHESMTGFGNYHMIKQITWTSFHNTFDNPPVMAG